MRGRGSWLLGAAFLLAATAVTAQPLPCSSVSPEARDYVRQRGACRDVKPASRPRASTQAKPKASDRPTSAPQEFSVPDVIGRSDADAARALANFKVERIETASAAPAGEVLAQEPAPDTLGRQGSTVILRVSDGSLATAARADPVATAPVTAPVTAEAAPSTTAPATYPAPGSTAGPMLPQVPAVPSEAIGQSPTALSANAALIFGGGMLLGLLSGALLMRARLLRRQRAVGEVAPPSAFAQSLQSVGQQPLEQQIVNQEPVDQQRVDLQPVDGQPAESDAGVDSQPSAISATRFTARFVPGKTTIVLAPFKGADEVSIEDSIDHHA